MLKTLISTTILCVLLQACTSTKYFQEDRDISCIDERTGHELIFNTGEVVSLYGNVYGQGPFFVNDYRGESMLIDYVATSLLTCDEEIIMNL